MNFNYNKNMPIISYIEKTIAAYGEKVAIEDDLSLITYAQLGEKIKQTCAIIAAHGLSHHDRVGIYCAPSINMIVYILSLIKMGICYVPIDVSYPKDRVDYIVSKCQLKYIFTDENISLLNNALPSFDTQIKPGQSDDPAYIIFTSGSTGNPKGVIITQQAIINHMLWMQDQFKINHQDKILLKTPIGFDPSVWEMLLPFFCGATLTLAPQGTHINPKLMTRLIKTHHITILQLVPAVLDALLKESTVQQCTSLRYVFVGGESLKLKTKIAFFKTLKAKLINLYGPTEATIDCTFHEVQPSDRYFEKNCIGQPIYNTTIFILNSALEPCEMNEIGELYIAGDGLSIGYFDNPRENKAKFVYIPKITQNILYKTGDLAFWNADGKIELTGRNDDQIKINGVRFEPDEMINFIAQHFGIDSCIIKYENEAGYATLICFLAATQVYEPFYLKQKLTQHFPHYMIPKYFLSVPSFPLTPNGKVDKRYLLDLFMQQNNDKTELKTTNSIENRLRDIWKGILGNHISFSNNDDFFNKGGDSLSAIALIVAIEEAFDVHIELEMLTTETTIHLQKNMIDRLRTGQTIQSAENRHVLCLKSSGQLTPIFLVHPIGGTVFWYKHLAQLLKTDHKIYTIQDPAIIDFNKRFNTIHDMAKFYVNAIRNIQPHGPYLLGGASFGAIAAIEMAKILTESNNAIEHIFNFDGWAVHPKELDNIHYFQTAMLRQQLAWKEHFTITKTHFDSLDKYFDIQMHRLKMVYDYKIESFPWAMTLFKPKETMSVFKSIDEPYNHWKPYALNGIQKIVVPGDHETMFQSPFVEILAQKLDGLLLQNSKEVYEFISD